MSRKQRPDQTHAHEVRERGAAAPTFNPMEPFRNIPSSSVFFGDTQERKLFFEFLRDLEKFESRNGLDHYRVRPSLASRRRRSLHDDDDGVSSRHCEEDGTTVVHLGPMLKAAIKFYV